ncbi:ring finger protein [Ophiostoma piceae UAMH 11346]|uniref:RBR-type E3 ubiquitin transferase n=1 Tax=Ophiostoma piceae (strain UAMH 11346) TaxID=1262450 RepID=S3CQQ0_OPHP1|nr:ring finger protein [Ophiostoma piceae UAMH 11346]
MADEIDDDDLRAVELYSLQAIYPDELTIDNNDRYAFSLEVPVNPAHAVTVAFPAGGGIGNVVNDAAGPAATASGPDSASTDPRMNGSRTFDTRELAYLPSLHLHITLPQGYPETEPPSVAISSIPMWLPDTVVTRLEDDCTRLWEEVGHDQVVFTFVEHLRQAADDAFGLVDESGYLSVNTQLKLSLLDYDIKSKQAAFARETFDCGVCLDPKKGSVCHRMRDCGHVFCVQCLQDFYGNAITEGELSSVRCLEPNCSKEREKARGQSAKQSQKPKLLLISPGELLQIPVDESLVKRYVDLTYKRELESDKTTVFCPRQWCSGAARSTRHKKPEGLKLHESGSVEEGGDGKGKGTPGDEEELDGRGYPPVEVCICDTCGFAFCSRCQQSWHGEFYYCGPPKTPEMTKEDLETLKYIEEHSTACPTCETPVSKTMGCNHMTCNRCNTHFCYLCAGWLDPYNPYQHYSIGQGGIETECANRLWDLQYGEDDEFNPNRAGHGRPNGEQDRAGAGRGRGRGGPAAAAGGGGGRGRGGGRANANRAVEPPAGNAPPVQVDVAREGPLVLRIAVENAPAPADGQAAANAHPPALAPAHAPAHAAAHAAAHGQGNARDRGRGRGRGQARGRGRGGGEGGGGARGGRQARGGARRGGRGGRGGAVGAFDMNAGLEFLAEAGIVPDADFLAEAGLLAGGGGHLDADAEAWIREFVALALEDNEHLMD